MQKILNKNSKKKDFKSRLNKYIIRLIKFLDVMPKETTAYEIKKQLIRSGMSIGANYFEAEAASSKKDYKNYFRHCLKSANESKFWFGVIKDAELIKENLLSELFWLSEETKQFANIFASSIITMQKR